MSAAPRLVRILSALALVATGALLVACPSTGPGVQQPAGSGSVLPPIAVTPDPSTSAAAAPTAPAGTAAPSGTTGYVSPPGQSAVKAPVFSEDSCAKDVDCEPVAECHASRCVASANAGKMTKGTLCTMDCRGGTIDCGFNHCGCADAPGGGKRCALLPGKP